LYKAQLKTACFFIVILPKLYVNLDEFRLGG